MLYLILYNWKKIKRIKDSNSRLSKKISLNMTLYFYESEYWSWSLNFSKSAFKSVQICKMTCCCASEWTLTILFTNGQKCVCLWTFFRISTWNLAGEVDLDELNNVIKGTFSKSPLSLLPELFTLENLAKIAVLHTARLITFEPQKKRKKKQKKTNLMHSISKKLSKDEQK